MGPPSSFPLSLQYAYPATKVFMPESMKRKGEVPQVRYFEGCPEHEVPGRSSRRLNLGTDKDLTK